jgi:hypothetical protein
MSLQTACTSLALFHKRYTTDRSSPSPPTIASPHESHSSTNLINSRTPPHANNRTVTVQRDLVSQTTALHPQSHSFRLRAPINNLHASVVEPQFLPPSFNVNSTKPSPLYPSHSTRLPLMQHTPPCAVDRFGYLPCCTKTSHSSPCS